MQIDGPNPFRELKYWFLDILQYGFLIALMYAVFVGWPGTIKIIMYMISFGVLRWIFLDMIRETKKAIIE